MITHTLDSPTELSSKKYIYIYIPSLFGLFELVPLILYQKSTLRLTKRKTRIYASILMFHVSVYDLFHLVI